MLSLHANDLLFEDRNYVLNCFLNYLYHWNDLMYVLSEKTLMFAESMPESTYIPETVK